MVYIRNILGLACLALPIFVQASSSASDEGPIADADIICATTDETDCYPRVFEPTEDFQVIREGQDVPAGLHIRMDINTGEREARLNVPMEGEDSFLEALKELPIDKSVFVVPQPDAEPEDGQPAMREQVSNSPPIYESAGKILQPPPSGDEFTTFETALIFIKTEARAFDKSLDDLVELSHDIYYGLHIAKDPPVFEKLLCLLIGSGSDQLPAKENGRDHKAARIIANAVQNNPAALKEVGNLWNMFVFPHCGADLREARSNGKGDAFSFLRSKLGREKDPQTLKAKITAISGLLKEPTIRQDFIDRGGMEMLLAIFLKQGVDFDIVRRKVAELVTDNFLDDGMGATLGIWPKMPANDASVCRKKGHMLEDGCWEYHANSFYQMRQTALWSKDFGKKLKERRDEWVNSVKHSEL